MGSNLEALVRFIHRLLATATVIALLSSCSDSDQGSLTDELDAALDRIEQLELSLAQAEAASGTSTTTSTVAPTSTTAAPTTTTASPTTTTTTAPVSEESGGQDCVVETTGGAIAGIEFETDILKAVATLVDRCGVPDINSGWSWSCALNGPGYDGPVEPERNMIWGNLRVTFWRQPDSTWVPQEFSETPTYFNAGTLWSWQFLDWDEDRVALDLQEAGITFGTPMSEIAAAVGVGEAPDAWYAESGSWDDPWDAYVDNVLSVFGLLEFVGGDGVNYAGWVDDPSPATFEDALATTNRGLIGRPSFCD